MNIQDIIDNLKLLQAEIEWDYSITYHIAITEAIKVLQKHIPQAPIAAQGEPLFGYCPSCNTAIYKYQNPNVCKWCTQCLDWNVEKTN